MKSRVFLSVLAISAIALDRLTKMAAERILADGRNIPVFGDFLSFRLVHNIGIAFSFPITGILLKTLTVGLIAFVGYYFFRMEKYRTSVLVSSFYAFLFAGAVGNAFDRLTTGRVTDFINLKYFAVFNLADMMIVVSAAGIIAFHAFHERNRE